MRAHPRTFVQLVRLLKKYNETHITQGGFHSPPPLALRYRAGFTLQRTKCLFYFRSQLLCGHGGQRVVHCRGKHEARFELVVMRVSVNSGAVGGGFRVHSCRSHRRLIKARVVHVVLFFFLFFLNARLYTCVSTNV